MASKYPFNDYYASLSKEEVDSLIGNKVWVDEFTEFEITSILNKYFKKYNKLYISAVNFNKLDLIDYWENLDTYKVSLDKNNDKS